MQSEEGKQATVTVMAPPNGTLLDDIAPDRQFSDQISVTVTATPARILRAFNAVTPEDMPIANVLGKIRYLPARLLGRSQPAPPASQSFTDALKQNGTVILAETPNREIVFGGIGKYHQVVDQEPVQLKSRDEFFAFQSPEYQKLVMSLRIELGERAGEYRLVLEHRTLPLSADSRHKFARYWLIIKPLGAFVTKQLLIATKRRAETNEPTTTN